MFISDSMNKRFSILLATISCTMLCLSSQELVSSPKLVVGITVDQLRSDYLRYFWGALGDRGFKRLYNEGIVFNNVDYGIPNVDKSSAVAILHTGAYPFAHGIASDMIYDKRRGRPVSCMEDPSYMGNSTAQTVSPNALLTSTVGDELKFATEGRARVFSVAPDLQQTLLQGGHVSDGAVWLDDYTGKWATTTYYKTFPWYIDEYNARFPLEKRIEDLGWLPVNEPQSKFQLPFIQKDFSFMHIFSKEEKLKEFIFFKTSGLINAEVSQVVNLILKNDNLGKNENYPDMLNVTYYAGTYRNKSEHEMALEIKDTYVRLDNVLECLLDSLDKRVGLSNTLIYLTSTGYQKCNDVLPAQFPLPTGEFFPRRCIALLSMYLVATYGNGSWVEGYHNDQIYLNRTLIEEKGLSLDEFQRRCAEFVIQMSGVLDVVPASSLMHGYYNREVIKARNGYSKKTSGDLLLTLQPGWVVRMEDENRPDYTVRSAAINFPLIFFGLNFKPEKHNRPVYVTEIAPTISSFLHIRSPNGAVEKPMIEVVTNR